MKEKMNLADNKEESSEEEDPSSGSVTKLGSGVKIDGSGMKAAANKPLPEDKEIHSVESEI
jgi:hypothetical protein